MKLLFPIIACVAFTLNLAGCSSMEDKPANPKAATDRPANGTSAANAANTVAPADVASVDKETAGTVEEPTSDETRAGRLNSKLEAMRRDAENSPPPKIDIEAELKKSTIPAPENSEFGAVLADAVYERRTFKNHPQLLKVEKISKGAEKTIKVFLKDGRVVDLPGEKIDFISKATSASILQMAGAEAPVETRRTNSKSKKP